MRKINMELENVDLIYSNLREGKDDLVIRALKELPIKAGIKTHPLAQPTESNEITAHFARSLHLTHSKRITYSSLEKLSPRRYSLRLLVKCDLKTELEIYDKKMDVKFRIYGTPEKTQSNEKQNKF